MKKTKFKRMILAALLAALLSMICACQKGGAAPVSGSELEALRAQYPYAQKNEQLAQVSINDIAAFNNSEFAAFVAVTITGAYTTGETTDSPAEGMPATATTTYYIPAHVDSVLCQNSLFGGQNEITLRIRGAMDGDNLNCYQTGKKLVTMLTFPAAGLNALADEYFSGTESSFYISDNNVLLAMSDQHPAFNEYSGWNLDAFRQELKKKFS